MKKNNNRGITLIALAITVIVLIIIASISTYSGVEALRESRENAQLSEVGMVQQAVFENYVKYKTTGNNMYIQGKAGNRKIVSYSDMQSLVDEINSKVSDGNEVSLKNEYNYDFIAIEDIAQYYYELSEADLKEMGFLQVEDNINTYIVNFITGEVFNKDLKVTRSGKPLYIYSDIQDAD